MASELKRWRRDASVLATLARLLMQDAHKDLAAKLKEAAQQNAQPPAEKQMLLLWLNDVASFSPRDLLGDDV